MRCNLLGNEHPYVAVSLNNLGRIVSDQGKLEEAEGLHRHALAIRRKYYGTDHREVANSLANLALVLERESNLAEAETISRECLAICEKKLPGEWETFNCQSQLGGILVAQKRCAEAEPLLVSGWAGLKQQEQRIPYDCKSRQREALARLVQLYEATSRPVQAAEWKQKLADFEKAQTSNQIAAVQLSVKASGQAQ